MGKRSYNRVGMLEERQQANCCNANNGCVTPPMYDPDVIISECIFVEKVYDAVMIRDEVDRVLPDITVPDFPIPEADIDEFLDITITCSSAGLVVTDQVLSINGQTPACDPTFIPGPGGINQINLACIDTSECDAEGKGTPLVVDQMIDIDGEVELKISGTVLKTDGEEQTFNVTTTIDLSTLDPITLRKFARLCMPSSQAAMKPSLAVFCGVLCDLILPFGLDSVSVDVDTLVITGPILIFCLTCEKKVKVPVQLCVLSTGFCDYPQQDGLCVEFPKLFPDQINPRVITPCK